jgi:hypothetical protein
VHTYSMFICMHTYSMFICMYLCVYTHMSGRKGHSEHNVSKKKRSSGGKCTFVHLASTSASVLRHACRERARARERESGRERERARGRERERARGRGRERERLCIHAREQTDSTVSQVNGFMARCCAHTHTHTHKHTQSLTQIQEYDKTMATLHQDHEREMQTVRQQFAV